MTLQILGRGSNRSPYSLNALASKRISKKSPRASNPKTYGYKYVLLLQCWHYWCHGTTTNDTQVKHTVITYNVARQHLYSQFVPGTPKTLRLFTTTANWRCKYLSERQNVCYQCYRPSMVHQLYTVASQFPSGRPRIINCNLAPHDPRQLGPSNLIVTYWRLLQ